MSFLKPRNLPVHVLETTYNSAGISRLTGLTRGRIAQLRAAGAAHGLPAPDAAGSTQARPLWRGATVARWCAASGRRLPSRTASWLLPGPDGPHLRRAEQTTIQLHQDDAWSAPAGQRREPIDVHVARYTAADSPESGSSVWLATVLAPSEGSSLAGVAPLWPHGGPLQHLVHTILADVDPGRFEEDALLGTLVVLPTDAEPRFGTFAGMVRILDLYRFDLEDGEDPRARLQVVPTDSEMVGDLSAAIGHRLPWWPPGCATPDLVASWQPESTVPRAVPPPLADAHAFRRRCEVAASGLDAPLAASLCELGAARWGQASAPWRPGYVPARGGLPGDCPDTVWQVAVGFTLSGEQQRYAGDFWEGLEWLMDHAPSPALARDAHRVFGDPSSAGVVLIDTARLPPLAAPDLTSDITSVGPTRSFRAQRVLDAVDAQSLAARGAVLGRWPAPAGPAWCATAPGTTLLALHVPRAMPAPGSADIGDPLDVIVVQTVQDNGYGRAPAIGLIATDRDHTVVLPEFGDAAQLAAGIEHTVWHPGVDVHLVGLVPSYNEELVRAIDSLISASAHRTPWEELASLVGPHAAEEGCSYCSAASR